MQRQLALAFLVVSLASQTSAPVFAANGVVLLTAAKAQAGGVTPGDTPGYPITLSAAGSYQLGDDLIVPANKVGILVTDSFVTIDFNGFSIRGSGTALQAISGSTNSVTIRNGFIARFKLEGIRGAGDSWVVEKMQVLQNGKDGIKLGNNARVTGNTISDNAGGGLVCNSYCHAEGNLVSRNEGIGVNVVSGMVLGNTIINNTSYGLYMFYGAFGNNTLIQNNNDQAGSQILGATYQLNPNFCNPACPP